MPITLRGLVDRADLGLGVAVAGDLRALDRPVLWVHSTELLDPTRFLDGGELILTTGANLPREDGPASEAGRREIASGFVSRLAEAGVCGIGFGVCQHHDEAPSSLVHAAREHRMPLLLVPDETPFIAITKAISRALMDDEFEQLNRGYHTYRRLIAAASAKSPTRAVVLRTAQLVGGWAALLDATGRAIEVSHLSATAVAERVAKGTGGAGERATFTSSDDVDIASYPLFAPSGRHIGYLVAGRRGGLGALDHGLVAVATTLLSLSMNRNERAERLIRRVRSATLHQLLESGPAAVRAAAADVWDGLPAEPLTVIRASASARGLAAIHTELEPFDRSARRRASAVAFGDGDGDGALWIVCHDQQAGRLTDQLLALDATITLGLSRSVRWDELARARREASAASTRTRRPDARVALPEDLASLSVLGLIDDDRARALADAQLGPLLEPAAARADLLATLACWLKHNAHLDATAVELGIHRHTLTKRLAQVELRLGRSLDSPDTRAELWFACRIRARS